MKVLILNALYHPNLAGGAERSVQMLAEHLVLQGVETVVASTVPRGAGRTDHVNGVRVVYMPMANLFWPYDGVVRSGMQRKLWHLMDAYNPLMQAAVASLIRREVPGVVHVNNLQGFSVAAWSAARAAGVPILHTLRDYYLACARASRHRVGRNCAQTCWECRPFAFTRRLASSQVGGVVGNSRFILEVHRSLGFFPQTNLWRVIQSACTPAAPAAERRPNAQLTFGYLGRLDAAKGLDVLLETFGARADKGWRLVVAGDGPSAYLARLRARHATLPARDSIHFAGVADADRFLASIDVLVVPSLWHDPLPRVIIEAAAQGTPAIASRRGGNPEPIDDGVNGLLFDPEEPQTLGAAIDRLLADRPYLERLQNGARLRAGVRTAEQVALHYADAYCALLPQARRGAAAPPVSGRQ